MSRYLQNWLYQGIGYDASAIPKRARKKFFARQIRFCEQDDWILTIRRDGSLRATPKTRRPKLGH